MRLSKRNKPVHIVAICIVAFLVVTVLVQYLHQDEAHAADVHGLKNERNGQHSATAGNKIDGGLANCRYGVTSAEVTAHIVPTTGAGVFYKFNQPNWFGPLPENGAELMHMIKTRQHKTASGDYLPSWYLENVSMNEELAGYIRDDPGAIWIVGNEVERGPNPGETWTARTGDMYADIYADAYHDVYHFIKGIDPTARVANAGLIQVTPMRLQYLSKMWEAYKQKYNTEMPVDVWTIHTYVLPELDSNGQPNNIASAAIGTDLHLGKRNAGGDAGKCQDDAVYCYAEHDDLSILEEQILSMRQWMKDRGQEDKPLIITEYGTLYHYIEKADGKCGGLFDEFGQCFVPERVTKFMRDSFHFFNHSARDANLGMSSDDNRLVQQWIWYGAWEWDIGSSNLLEDWNGKTLTMMGEAFRDHIQDEPTYVNLLVDDVKSTIISQGVDDTVTSKLSVTFRNNGNVAINDSFVVTFYSDENRTQTIGSVNILPEIRGCAIQAYVADVEWSGLPIGTHQFWVKVDSAGAINETPADKSDNVGSGQVKVTGPVYPLNVEIVNDGIGQGGVVAKNPDEEAYEEGTKVTLTAVPYSGWIFDGWTGAVVGSSQIADITITEETAVTARFTQEKYKVEYDVVGQGAIRVWPSPLKEYYVYGDYLELGAIPAEGWRFVGWTGDITDGSPDLRLTIDADITTTATFKELPIKVEGNLFLPVAARAN